MLYCIYYLFSVYFFCFILKKPLNNVLCTLDADLSREEELQNNFSYAAGSIKMVQEMPQLKLNNYMSAVGNASARARSETKNVAEGLSFSPFLQFDNQSGGKTKASENLWNDESSIMPKKLYSDYGHTGRQSNNSGIRTNKSLNNDKGVNFAKDSGVKINSGFGIGQLMKYPSSIKRAVGGSDISVVNGKIHELNHESSLPSDTSVCADILRGSNNVSFLGQENHTPETSISFKGILKGLSHHVSSSVSNQTPTLPQQQQGINMDSCLLDENLRLLALTQILELSKQQHALYFNNMNQKQGGSNSISKVQHYMYEASTSEQGTSGATLKLLQNRGIYGNHESTVGLEKLASLTGTHNAFFIFL